MHDGHYFIFDSHARNHLGAPDSNGNAVLLQFTDFHELYSYIENFYSSHQQFELSPLLLQPLILDTCRNTDSSQTSISDTANCNDFAQETSSNHGNYCNLKINDPITSNNNEKEKTHEITEKTLSSCRKKDINQSIKKSDNKAKFISHRVCVPSFTLDHSYSSISKGIRFNAPKKSRQKNKKTYERIQRITNADVTPNDKKADEFCMAVDDVCKDSQIDSFSINTNASSPAIDLANVEFIAVNHSYANVAFADTPDINNCPNLELLDKKKQLDRYLYEHSIQMCADYSCKSCHKFLFADKKKHLRQETDTSRAYKITVLDNLCQSCCNQIEMDKIPKFSFVGNMFDTGTIPTELKQLDSIEKRLIALIQVFMTIIQLPGGQYAERGSVVNFLSPYIDIACQLPAKDSIIAVKFVDAKPEVANIVSYISPVKIHQALLWLQFNNHLYTNCNILNLPDTSSNDFIDFECMNESSIIATNYSVPNVKISDAVKEKDILNLKKISSAPISPYSMPYGEEMAFPWLFPEGVNGYLSQRPMKISLREYFHQRMNDFSGNFRKDLSYLLNSVNVCDNEKLRTDISIHMLMRKPQHENSAITVKDINNLQDNPDLLQNSYMFMKGIRGTVAYWKNALSDLLAMLKCLGPPTLFVTLSADDCHWPELAMLLTNCKYEEVNKHLKDLPFLMKKDPYMTAVHFQRRYNALFKFILKSRKKPLGEIEDFFCRVEFQNRGSPHYHLFYWIKDIPVVTDAKTADIALTYIDKTICTCLPDKNSDVQFYKLVKQLQTHTHTDYCMKNRHTCRFGFPFQPTERTHFYSNFDLSLRGKTYATKRSSDDAYVNAYNPVILQHFRSNMDIQFVNNAESAAYYVCAYLCKAEPDELKKEFSKLITDLLNSNEAITLHSRLLRIGSCVLKNRRLSAQEAAFRISNLKLVQCSRNVVYLNCKPKAKRMKVLKPLALRVQLPDDSTDIFLSNIIDYYHFRPTELEQMSLFRFASSYQICQYSPVGTKGLPRYKLLKFEKWIREKRKKNVIRLPKMQINSNDYFFSILLLHLPHRDEEELIAPYKSAEEAVAKKRSEMDTSLNCNSYVTDQIENAVRMYRLTHDEISQAFMLSSLTQPVDASSEEIANISFSHEAPSTSVTEAALSNSFAIHQEYENDEHELHSLQVATCSEEEIQKRIDQLTHDQKKVFNYIKQKITKDCKANSEKVFAFASGGAGTGKSYLLSLIADFLSLTTPIKYGESPVLLTAPTGTAARNIHGLTLHTALALPVENEYNSNKFSVSGWTLKKLRQKFAYIHTIMIDEISMVSAKMLTLIHERLCTISDTDNIFGNFNIILFGDFFQLKPVKENFYAFENHLLWPHFKPFILKQNMRQSSDQPFIELLNRARTASLTSEDITILKSHMTQSISHLPDFHNNALHLLSKRQKVCEMNSRILRNAVDKRIVSVSAIHFYSQNDIGPSQEFDETHIPKDDRNAGGMPKVLELCVGSRVMLLRNIFTSQGLVNGALGQVEAIECSEENVPSSIYVLFDDPNVGRMLQDSAHHNAIPIQMCDQEYFYKGRCIIRRQFPLNLAWFVTIHKAEGCTRDEVYCDIGSDIFENGMSYVALSRVRTLQGLHLYAFNPDKVTADPRVLKFYNKISDL